MINSCKAGIKIGKFILSIFPSKREKKNLYLHYHKNHLLLATNDEVFNCFLLN
jgi:hypothetical protein